MSAQKKPVVIKELHKNGAIRAAAIKAAVLAVVQRRAGATPIKPDSAKAKRAE